MILETERLFLRELRQTDFRDLAEILQNPKVMYAYEHDFSDDDVQIWLNIALDLREAHKDDFFSVPEDNH